MEQRAPGAGCTDCHLSVTVPAKTGKKKNGLWLEEGETEPRTRHPGGDRRLTTATAVLTELALSVGRTLLEPVS